MEAHSSGSSPKNITTGIGISDADVATPDSPKHITGTQGSDKRRTYGADRKERNQQYDIPPTKKLTPSGGTSNKDPQNPEGVASGASASHESGIQSIETRTGKNRSGVEVDPEKKTKPQKRGTPEGSKTGGATPKIKAALDYAIIQCQLLKMNGIIKRGEWDHLGHAKKEADEKEESKEKETPKAEDYTKEEHDKKTNAETSKYPMYKSEDIVSKAIELINTAYDEMNKGKNHQKEDGTWETDEEFSRRIGGHDVGYKVQTQEGDDIKNLPDRGAKKKDAPSTTSSEGSANFVYSDVHEKKKQEEKPCKHCGVGHKDGKSLGLSGEQEFHDRGHKLKPSRDSKGEL